MKSYELIVRSSHPVLHPAKEPSGFRLVINQTSAVVVPGPRTSTAVLMPSPFMSKKMCWASADGAKDVMSRAKRKVHCVTFIGRSLQYSISKGDRRRGCCGIRVPTCTAPDYLRER